MEYGAYRGIRAARRSSLIARRVVAACAGIWAHGEHDGVCGGAGRRRAQLAARRPASQGVTFMPALFCRIQMKPRTRQRALWAQCNGAASRNRKRVFVWACEEERKGCGREDEGKKKDKTGERTSERTERVVLCAVRGA